MPIFISFIVTKAVVVKYKTLNDIIPKSRSNSRYDLLIRPSTALTC